MASLRARISPTARAQTARHVAACDGLAGQEGAFSICTFWLAQALATIGDYDAGVELFERMLKRANHLGLHSEQTDPRTESS